MSLLPALAVAAAVVAAAGQGPADTSALAAAQAAFAAADYPRAEALAQAAAAPPNEGAALYLVGLARFREGRPEEALAALAKAAAAADPPPRAAFRYNEGSCLYELGRFAEAERRYEEAAALDPALAAVSLVNAGYAALDAGSKERARAFAVRARATGSAAALQLIADLEARIDGSPEERATAEYREGLAAFDARRFAEARERFLRAAELDPRDGRSRVMSGASALRLGERAEAERDLTTALSLQLDGASAAAARDYLDSLSHGLPARGRGFEGALRAAAGYDSDALQLGLYQLNEFPGASTSASPSALTSTALSLWLRTRPGDKLFAELSYGFDQLAYLASSASDRSLQQHELSVALETPLSASLRLGGSLSGQLAFTGLSSFRGLQAAASVSGWAALDETASTTTRLDVEYSRKQGLSEFGYLTGDRVDVTATQELRLDFVTLGAGARGRAELIGTARQQTQRPPPLRVCGEGCTQQTVDPFAYAGATGWLSARARLLPRLVLDVSGGIELRHYLSDNALLLTPASGSSFEVGRERRRDLRFFSSAAATFALTPRFSLFGRYDLLISRSNVQGDQVSSAGEHCGPSGSSCGALQGDDRSYDKHVFTAGTAFSF